MTPRKLTDAPFSFWQRMAIRILSYAIDMPYITVAVFDAFKKEGRDVLSISFFKTASGAVEFMEASVYFKERNLTGPDEKPHATV